MASKDDKRPIIIKKIKKGGHGHHGGAWKVAYADFVTAMMAFFLLLWLLSTSSKETLQGLSEYFTPTQGLKDAQGIGFDGGLSPSEQGIGKSNKSDPGLVSGATPTGMVADDPVRQAKSDSQADDSLFKEGASSIEQAFSNDAALRDYMDNINVRQTAEGLVIDITDTDRIAMFEAGTAELTEHGKKILARMTELVKKMPNYMSITGHTDASPAEAGRADYTNWELSSDRAQAARRFMLRSGIEPERPRKVTGMADRELYTPKEPRGPKNRRISMTMLRGSHIMIPEGAVPPHVRPEPEPDPVPAPKAPAAPPTPAVH